MLHRSYPPAAVVGAPPRPHDLTTFEEFVAFMELTGRAPTVRTAQRWAREDRLTTWIDPTDPRGRRRRASMTDLLESHRRRQTD